MKEFLEILSEEFLPIKVLLRKFQRQEEGIPLSLQNLIKRCENRIMSGGIVSERVNGLNK